MGHEDLVELAYGVAVCHGGDVVHNDGNLGAFLAVRVHLLPEMLLVLLRDDACLVEVLLVILKQRGEHPLGLLFLCADNVAHIDVVEHEFAEGVAGLVHIGIHLHHVLAERIAVYRGYCRIDPLSGAVSKHLCDAPRDVLLAKDTGAHGVLYVMVYVCDPVRLGDAPGFKRHGIAFFLVVFYAVPHFKREVEPFAALFQHFHHPAGLQVVQKAAALFPYEAIEYPLSAVPEGRMAQVMPQSYGFRQVLVERQAARKGPCYLGYIQSVREPCDVMVPLRREKDLRLVLEPSEGVAVYYPVPVPLEVRAHGAGLLRTLPFMIPFRLAGVRRKELPFLPVCPLFEVFHHPVRLFHTMLRYIP